MNKTEKETTVKELHEKMAKATFAATVSFSKLDARHDIELRKAMRDGEDRLQGRQEHLGDPGREGNVRREADAALHGTDGRGDRLRRRRSSREVRHRGVQEGTGDDQDEGRGRRRAAMDAKGVEALSKMPGLNELRARAAGHAQAAGHPALSQIINAPGSSLARVLQAHVDKAGEGEKAA